MLTTKNKKTIALPYPRMTLAACICGSSLAFIDGSVVNVALPALGQSLHASPASLSAVVSSYLLPLSSLILFGGALGDRFGRRPMLMGGIAIFLLASILCALSPNLPLLLSGRVLQGVGAALLMPNSLALLGASFEGEEKGRAIGIWAGVGALASALGPVLGGWLVDGIGWRTIFFLNLPIGLTAITIVARYVQEARDGADRQPLDGWGACLITTSLGLLTWALTAAAEPHASMLYVKAALGLGAILLFAFVITQIRKGEGGLMPLYLMKTPTFVGVTLLTFFLYGALGGLIVLLPFLLIRIEHFSAVQAGAA